MESLFSNNHPFDFMGYDIYYSSTAHRLSKFLSSSSPRFGDVLFLLFVLFLLAIVAASDRASGWSMNCWSSLLLLLLKTPQQLHPFIAVARPSFYFLSSSRPLALWVARFSELAAAHCLLCGLLLILSLRVFFSSFFYL